jgi:hypothetical protein
MAGRAAAAPKHDDRQDAKIAKGLRRAAATQDCHRALAILASLAVQQDGAFGAGRR